MESQALNLFKNISQLLQHGLFPGANGIHVAQAINFLDQVIADETAKLQPDATPPEVA